MRGTYKNPTEDALGIGVPHGASPPPGAGDAGGPVPPGAGEAPVPPGAGEAKSDPIPSASPVGFL